MATTSPDNIWSPDSGDDYALTVDLAAMADTVQDALTSRPRTYRTGTDAERLAITGADLFDGLRFFVTSTGVEWLYANGAWISQDTGWIAPPLLNGWTLPQPTDEPLGYRRIDGIVYLRGRIALGTPDRTAFILPVGFRPATLAQYRVRHGNTGDSVGVLIRPNGDVIVQEALQPVLGGISPFPAV